MTDLGDPGFMDKDDDSRIVGRIVDHSVKYFVRADGSRRQFTAAEELMVKILVEKKQFTSLKYYDKELEEVLVGDIEIQYMDPIICKEIITGYLDI